MVGLLLETLWRTARLAQFDAYLGNPDATGRSSSRYTFRLDPLEPEQQVVAALPPHVNALGIAGLAFAVLLGLFGGAVVWSRA
jgi:hypothetical protein